MRRYRGLAACLLIAVAIPGASASASRAETPAAQAISLLKQAETDERNVLHALDSFAYDRAGPILRRSDSTLQHAESVIKAGRAAGSVGPGIKPTAVTGVLGKIAAAHASDLDAQKDILDAGYVANGAKLPPIGMTKDAYEEGFVKRAQDDLNDALADKAKAILD